MKSKNVKITVSEEENRLGEIWLERIIERLLLEQLDLPIKLQSLLLSKHYKGKDDINVS
ncbi:hypothetical protein H1D32_21090 [Anaerobacillus sp. CMMVII]|uniref:hypothetical protein n=1 Tax=Anaerobacillus sp. CMMVII TaxID=2755588 RepID=UPI0021B74234|nr:hypothetical protein [Anaerobacillus sp. CMMVII]MCT8139974.1 hypothetical protein [Anaerobacillus sp. CMMVII]